jgi:hypothetical protein
MAVRANHITLLKLCINRLYGRFLALGEIELLIAANMIEIHNVGWVTLTAIYARDRLLFNDVLAQELLTALSISPMIFSLVPLQ